MQERREELERRRQDSEIGKAKCRRGGEGGRYFQFTICDFRLLTAGAAGGNT
jgi:hypothetical protein